MNEFEPTKLNGRPVLKYGLTEVGGRLEDYETETVLLPPGELSSYKHVWGRGRNNKLCGMIMEKYERSRDFVTATYISSGERAGQ